MQKLSVNSKIWIFPLSKALNNQATAQVEAGLEQFISTWKSHGQPVKGDFEIRYNQFVIMAADLEASHIRKDNELAGGIGGCSMDSLHRGVKEVVGQAGATLSDLSSIQYRSDTEIVEVSRSQFQQLVSDGKVSNTTTVFNNTIQSLSELQAGTWEVPLKDSWHKAAF